MDLDADLLSPSARDRAARSRPGDPVTADVVIVGAGLSGSLLALVLARRGVDVVVADIQPAYRSDFRCEKITEEQIALLDELGALDAVQAAVAPHADLNDCGFRYDRVVNTIRAAWPERVRFLTGRVADVVAEGERQRVLTLDGDLAVARLVVLATGPGRQLAARLGLKRRIVRERHSICLGFSLRRAPGAHVESLVHRGEKAGDRIGFVSLFPLGDDLRVNVFSYHDPSDAWVRFARYEPLAALLQVAPGLADRLAGAEAVDRPEVRAIDLYRTEGVLRPGLVLVGDAFQTACPSTGLGVTRLLTDVRQLAQVHLPGWLESPGMGLDKISAFYADPIKTAVDDLAARKAETARAAATETNLRWRARRVASRMRRRIAAANPGRRKARPARPLAHGDWVEVKSATEIAATLDADGRLDGLPFMPEMAAFCGATLRVHRRADRTCVEGAGVRDLSDAVLLEAARCDGSAHDGCERGCLFFWKEAWLRRAAGPRPSASRTGPAAASPLRDLPVRDGERYLCQSTLLASATAPMARAALSYLVADLRRGEISPIRFGEIVVRTVAKKLLDRMGRPELGSLAGQDGKTMVRLELRPGERVRVKSCAGIAENLDAAGRHRGLKFEPEMTPHAGELHTVSSRVTRIIHEETGKMVRIQATVALQGVDCQGRCTLNCPRSSPMYWREAWLERA